MSVNSKLNATKIIVWRRVFCRQRISECSCVRKETVDIDILVTSGNGDRNWHSCLLYVLGFQKVNWAHISSEVVIEKLFLERYANLKITTLKLESAIFY